MDVGIARIGNCFNKTILKYGLQLLSYYDAMNGTFINGLGIFFTIYLKIMTEVLFDNTINATILP